jgi:gas vesicle protein
MEAGMEVMSALFGAMVGVLGGVLIGAVFTVFAYPWTPTQNDLNQARADARSVAEEKLRISEELEAEKKRCNKENQMAIQERANAVRLRFELEAAHKHLKEFGATLKENVQARHEVQDDLNELRATLFQLSKPKP